MPIFMYGVYADSFLGMYFWKWFIYMEGTEAQKKKAALLKKLADKQTRSVKQLSHFTSNEWVFDDTNVQVMNTYLHSF